MPHFFKTSRRHRGFTLMELLVVISIIAVLAAILMPVFGKMKRHANQTAGLSNMRQVAAAMLSYASEHDYELPGRESGASGQDRWPKLIGQYVQDTRIFAAPGDPQNFLVRNADPLSSSRNNTSFIMNGFNDLGMLTQKSMAVRISSIETPVSTLLLGTPKAGSTHFFMDFLEPPHGNNKDVLNLKAYDDGSNYVFVDGSARFIREADYRDALWLVDKTYVIPNL
ncbi:MAG: type II secretion system GspH family protein [Chthoniobacter sp.]|nr:type II secretion system GspH family protein [Chthoniobacter sp.]